MREADIRGANLIKTGDYFGLKGAVHVRVRNNFPSRTILFGFAKDSTIFQLQPNQEDILPLPSDVVLNGNVYIELGLGSDIGHVQVMAIYPSNQETTR